MSRSGLRFTGGEHKGRRLEVPQGSLRPTEARVREALFSVWQLRVPGGVVLDLFAGSGAVGLEALARGAAQAIFVESSAKVLRCLGTNCGTYGAQRCGIVNRRLPCEAPELAKGFDLIFADPPYAFEPFEELLACARRWVAPTGELAIEHSRRKILPKHPPGWRLRDFRCYGESCLSFFLPTTGGGEAAAEG